MNKTELNTLGFDPFEKIGKEWMLITSGDMDNYNTMTASWGFAGVIWGHNSAEVVVRHSRYTYEFMEKNELFTLSFFGKEHHKALEICGSTSGRDTDKAAAAGLTPVAVDGSVSFDEASLVLVCKKMYAADIEPDKIIEEEKHWYKNDSIHRMYIGEIIAAYTK